MAALDSAATNGHDAIVVGAGPAGLATAAELQRRGLTALVLERGDGPGAAWAHHYDRLRLNTVRSTAGLPGRRLPRRTGRWPSRDDVAAYLRDYAGRRRLTVRSGVTVRTIAPGRDGGWIVETSAGPLAAPIAVVATGTCSVPHTPDWPGRSGFAGEVAHAAGYRDAAPYRGRDVLVAGAGNSGAEIALDLAEGGAARVRLAVRTPPQIVPRTVLGVPTVLVAIGTRRLPAGVGDRIMRGLQRRAVGDLSSYGLPLPAESISASYAASGVVPISVPGFADAVRSGRIEVVGPLRRFAGPRVAVGDAWIVPDAVIAATGYRADLAALLGAGSPALDAGGRPVVGGGLPVPAAPGLFLVGFANPLTGNLREIRLEARRLGRAAAAYCAVASASAPVAADDPLCDPRLTPIV
ncbi:ribonucleotide reductase large subunit [Baekduia alba]|uniref:flavin-containing monooxygenase n=1 Tax=Baekduia alba TaxID=2997333 RepID=UPI002341C6B6|nr:NAD(P)/FAD-dependent oxidoreductase [Baekduia alba]WCB95226.1 ribonucleotide reductase large subunit [Baekduia alba]